MPTFLLALMTASSITSPPAETRVEEYFMVITADNRPYNPARAHTFAALARVEIVPGQSPMVVEQHSLSWLPVTMKVRPFAFRYEKGRNVPLHETLEWAVSFNARINMWGPYRVCPEFAETFRNRVATVEGTYGYKGACLTSPKTVCDCARSVEEMIDPYRRFIGPFGYGAAAGSYIVKKFTPWFIEPQQSHPWVASAIGLDAYPINHRAYGDFSHRPDQFKSWLRRE
jgi:hypothetical protein